MRLFISHASEDKVFVRPLAEALQKVCEVWYDEYELTVGDSLLKKINEGLISCDFGVVVLSPFFFAKKWEQAELDGLFALEGATRKMILPVWKDVSVEDVKRSSPILAGRLAVNASEGVEKVVAELSRAIEVSNRRQQIDSLGSIVETAKSLDLTLRERANADGLSRSEQGVQIVEKGFDELIATFSEAISAIQKTASVLKLYLNKNLRHSLAGRSFRISTDNGLNLDVLLMGLGGNYTYESHLAAALYVPQLASFIPVRPVKEMDFTPSFKLPAELIWLDTHNKVHSNQQVVDAVLGALFEEIRRRKK